MPKHNPLRLLIILLVVLANIGCDQVSKSIVRQRLDYHEQIDLLNDRLILVKVENPGAFFGLGENLPATAKNLLLSALPALLVTGIFGFLFVRRQLPPLTVVALCCIVGGGIGNIFDRIAYGSVTDFLHIDLGFFRTGIFNMADVSIMVGLFLTLFTLKEKTAGA